MTTVISNKITGPDSEPKGPESTKTTKISPYITGAVSVTKACDTAKGSSKNTRKNLKASENKTPDSVIVEVFRCPKPSYKKISPIIFIKGTDSEPSKSNKRIKGPGSEPKASDGAKPLNTKPKASDGAKPLSTKPKASDGAKPLSTKPKASEKGGKDSNGSSNLRKARPGTGNVEKAYGTSTYVLKKGPSAPRVGFTRPRKKKANYRRRRFRKPRITITYKKAIAAAKQPPFSKIDQLTTFGHKQLLRKYPNLSTVFKSESESKVNTTLPHYFLRNGSILFEQLYDLGLKLYKKTFFKTIAFNKRKSERRKTKKTRLNILSNKFQRFCIISVKKTKNNSYCLLSNLFTSKTLFSLSAGKLKIAGGARKTRRSLKVITNACVAKASELGFNYAIIHIKGDMENFRNLIFNCVAKALNVVIIKEFTSSPHNGCRARKERRI